jgi:rubrerythrin
MATDEILEPTVDQTLEFFKVLRSSYKQQWYELLNSIRFAELRGGGFLAYLAEVLDDPEMMAKMTKHAADEAKHGHFVTVMIRREGGKPKTMVQDNLFRSMARAEGRDSEEGPPLTGPPAREDLIETFAGMQAIEHAADTAFKAFEKLFEDDPVILAMVKEVLKDEEFHIGWIAKLLDQWRREGFAEQIDDAMNRARVALAEARQKGIINRIAEQTAPSS